MLDKLMGHYARYKFNSLDEKYSPEKAIESSTLFNENAAALTVLFPPWRGGEGAYK